MEKLITKDLAGIKSWAKTCEEKLIARGYIYSSWFGWEKPEILMGFGVSPNGHGVPVQEYDTMESKDVTKIEKDQFGKPTGNKILERQWIATGQKHYGATPEWIAYFKWKNPPRTTVYDN